MVFFWLLVWQILVATLFIWEKVGLFCHGEISYFCQIIQPLNMLSSEEKIIEQLNQLIFTHLDNPDYSIEEICRSLGVSRSQLFRSIKEQTGLSISRYVRQCRLMKGKELLETTDQKIAEIAYQVGFDSPQTFSKYFTEDFGISPTEYRKNKENNSKNSEGIPLEEFIELAPEPSVIHQPLNRKVPTSGYAVLALLLIGLLVSGIYLWQTSKLRSTSTTDELENSIAVLPFKSIGSPETALLADGVTEQIHTSLAGFSHLKVISKNSSELFRDSKKAIPQIAAELHVGYVIGGTATRDGERLRITLELVKASEDRVVWTQQYEGKADELIGFINKIAQDVTRQFQQKPTGSLADRLPQIPTQNPEAYNEYLQGRQLLATRNKEKMLAGIEKFDRALALDPNFADAYASKAAIYFSLGNLSHIDLDSGFRLAEREALKAIRLDANNAQAYGLIAAVYRDEYRWEQANTTFQIALRCNPNDAQVNYWYSLMLRSVGLLEEAVKYSSKAIALDPLHPVILSGHLRNCSYADKTELVKENIQKGELLFSDSFLFYWSVGYHYLHVNDYPQALRALEKARQLNPSVKGIAASLAYTQARLGQSAEVKSYLASLSDTPYNDTYLAMAYAGLNDKANCLRSLERMAASKKLPTDVKVSPFFRFLWGDKRFDALLQQFGLLHFQLPE